MLTKKQITSLSRLIVASVVLVVGFLITQPVTQVAASEYDFSECPQHFANGRPPIAPDNPGMKLRALCFDGFAVYHSGKSHTPLYVAERLNRAIVEKDIKRTNHFYEEARLPKSERSTLADYNGSGFDRGHMAPAADMGTDEAMAQSFSLANMVPQAPYNNRKAWAKIEKDTRKYVKHAAGDVYVISGAVYDERLRTIGANKVWVPQYLFKLVYDPLVNKVWVHWVENTDEARAGKPISYDQLVQRTGIRFISNMK